MKDLAVGIVSFNRLHYLKALVRSWQDCVGDDNLCIVDNDSTEPGMAEFLMQYGGSVRLQNGSLHKAVNTLVDWSRRRFSKYLLVLPDDLQIVRADTRWIKASLELLDDDPMIESVTIDAQRRATLEHQFRGWRGLFTRQIEHAGEIFYSYGPLKLGFNGIGLCSITRVSTWERLGHLETDVEYARRWDASLGAEDRMLNRYRRVFGIRKRRVCLEVPAALEIVTDPAGHPAKVFKGKRYGHYAPPIDGDTYYHYWYPRVPPRLGRPVAFEEMITVAKPRFGFVPLDAYGNCPKAVPTESTRVEAIA